MPETTTPVAPPPVPAPALRNRGGFATYQAYAFLDGEPASWPRCRSDVGTDMAVEHVSITYQQSLDDGSWILEKAAAEGRYVHNDHASEPVITALTQTATWSPTSTLPPWLVAVVRELRPIDLPPGVEESDTRRAALAFAELPHEALEVLQVATRNVASTLDELGGKDTAARSHLAAARGAILRLWKELRRDARVEETLAARQARVERLRIERQARGA